MTAKSVLVGQGAITTQTIDSVSNPNTLMPASANAVNITWQTASAGFDKANSAVTNAAAAFATANAAFGVANNASSNASAAFAAANAASTLAGSAVTNAAAAFGQANTARTLAESGIVNAAAAFAQANGAITNSAAAFNKANTTVLKAGDTMTGTLQMDDNLIDNPILRGHSCKVVNLGDISGTVLVNISTGNYFVANSTGATTWTFGGATPGAGSNASAWIIELKRGGTQTQTWPSPNTKWPDATAPTFSSTGNDIIAMVTIDTTNTIHSRIAIANTTA